MAKPPKLYRTAAGFHDLYVAAPSRAAALRAWGSERDLFALEMAEEVTGTSPGDAARATPGTVVKVARGGGEDEEASPPALAGGARRGHSGRAGGGHARKVQPKPRPSRAKLDAAEAALDALMASQRAERAALEARHARERAALDKAQGAAHAKAEAARARAETAHDAALAKWRGG